MSASPTTSRRRIGAVPVVSQRNPRSPAKTRISSNAINTILPFEVLDIGGSALPSLLMTLLNDQLLTADSNGIRHLPALFFSDDKGLRMWSNITHLPNYYQTRDEIQLLKTWGGEMIRELGVDSGHGNGLIMIDLGAGDVRKVLPLLSRLDALNEPITYYALDLSSTSLATAMSKLSSQGFRNITCHGLWGSFNETLSFVRSLPPTIPRLFMSLGSMFGNDFPTQAISLLSTWRNEMRPYDRMLIGMDGTTDLNDIWDSYHDESGLFEKFIRNGMKFSNQVVGAKWFHNKDWDVKGFLVEEPWTMHRFIFTAKRAVVLPTQGGNVVLPAGEKIEGYRAFKLGVEEMRSRFVAAGLEECCVGWQSKTGRINQYLLKSSSSMGPYNNLS